MSNAETKEPVTAAPKSERHRVCPECQAPFTAEHLLMKFCCDKHRNAFNNRRKRIAKAEKVNQTQIQRQVETQKNDPISTSTEIRDEPKLALNQTLIKEKQKPVEPSIGDFGLLRLFRDIG